MKKQLRIQTRMILIAAVPVLITAAILTVFFLLDRFNRIENDLRDHGRALTRQYAAVSVGHDLISRQQTEASSHLDDCSL